MVRGLMSDEEWGFFEPFVIERGPKRGRPPGDHRLVLDGVFWLARTGAPWRFLPDDFGKWSSVYRQFRRSTPCETSSSAASQNSSTTTPGHLLR